MSNITETYKTHLNHQPDKVAIYTTTQEISYRVWYELVSQTANWLTSTVCEGGKVGILMPNGIPFLQLFAGTASVGYIAIPLDMKWKGNELEQRLALVNPTVLITTKELANHYQLDDLSILIWEEIEWEIQKMEPIMQMAADDHKLFYTGFTSGTTGIPKAFLRAHFSWIKSFSSSEINLELSASDEVLIPGTLVHSHFLYGAICTLYLGGTLYLLDSFSPIKAIDWIEEYSINVIYTVPTMIEAITGRDELIEKSIKVISSGAKWSCTSQHKLRQRFATVEVFEFYGASELSFVTYLNDRWNQEKPNSVGKVCDGVKLEIRDSKGCKVANGVIGKIYVKSPLLFAGYVQEHTDRLHTLRDEEGWVTVDDIGYIDHGGFLYLVAREKNMIISGGENVYPEEIEAVLLLHPSVKNVAVIGVEDSYWGQIPVAFIQGNVSKKDLRKLCQKHLSTFKYPRKWYFIEALPVTSSGKIASSELIKLLAVEVV